MEALTYFCVILELCKGVHCVDLGESFQTHILLQNLASIQPRMSPVKFARSSNAAASPAGGRQDDGVAQRVPRDAAKRIVYLCNAAVLTEIPARGCPLTLH